MLKEMPGTPVRVLVVWEPVLLSDIAPPLSAVLSLVSDRRAMQFWDPDRTLSQQMLQAARETPAVLPFDGEVGEEEEEGLIVWDYLAIYPAGLRWEDSMPAPIYGNAPVIRYMEEVRKRLVSAQRPSATVRPPAEHPRTAQPSPG